MQTFKDLKGNEWVIPTLTYFEEGEFRGKLKIDISKKDDVLRIPNEPELFLQVLWLLIGDQVKEKNLTDIDLKKAMDQDVFAAAANAIIEEILFFCRSQNRPHVEKILAAVKKRQADLLATIGAKVEKVCKKIESGKIDGELVPTETDPALSKSDTDSPAISG